MVKAKKDMLGQKFYKSMKNHPIIKNPIILICLAAIVFIVISYIIYLIYQETI